MAKKLRQESMVKFVWTRKCSVRIGVTKNSPKEIMEKMDKLEEIDKECAINDNQRTRPETKETEKGNQSLNASKRI